MIAPLRARLSSVFALTLTVAASLLTACGHGNFQTPIAEAGAVIKLEGFVHGGQQPITGATIQLYAAGTTGDMSNATPLIAAAPVTDASGSFSITGLYACPNITSEVYLVASGGNPGLAPGTNNASSVLMAALGPCGNLTSATHIIINEATTVGSIYPITAFMKSYLTVGSSSGDFTTLAADFMQINEFIDTNGGQSPGPTLPGGFTAPIANLYTLANSVSGCVNSTGSTVGGTACGNLFLYATPPGGTAPTNTADAVLDIANNPTNNVNNIFLLSTASPAFQPVLGSAPTDWSLKILPNIALTTPSNLVGVGSTTNGTITLGQAAPAGGLTINFVSNNTSAVTVVSPVNIPAGSLTGTFSYTGVAAGTATLTATATGYYTGTTVLSATSALISLGTVPTVAPGQSVDLPLSIGVPAPAGGVTINFTSTAPGVATVTGSSFIPAGLKIPASNPQVTGVTVGNAQINATATNYAPGSRNVSVSVTATLPSTFSVPVGTPTNETLTISAPAPAGGIIFALTVDNAAIFSVPSTVTVPQGSTTVNIPITGLTGGTTNLRADSPNITEAVSAVSVNGTISLGTTTLTTGKFLQNSAVVYLNTAPPAATALTLTSNNPAVFTVSTSPTVVGTTTTSFPSVTGTGYNYLYVQGTGVGTSTLTISAPGYTSVSMTITVYPSGFSFGSPSFSTTTLSPDSSLYLQSDLLDPTSLAVISSLPVAPGVSPAVAVTSGTTATGTITNSPATFATNSTSASFNFHPVAAGTSTLSLTTPAGFSTPATAQSITATVTPTPISLGSTTITTGVGLEVQTVAYLSQTPLVPTNVTVTSSNPAVAVASISATNAGATVATFTNVVSTGYLYINVQGLSLGTTTFTVAANAYTSAVINVTVNPSGFVLATNSFSTTSLSPASSINAQAEILNPTTLANAGSGSIIPQIAPVNLTISSATTSVGTVTSPFVFNAGSSGANVSFQPVGAGTSVLSLGTPAGFSTPAPASTQQLTATVTAPPVGIGSSTLLTGVNLETTTVAYLTQTPTAPVTVTITSSNPAVAFVSNSPTQAGAASTTFPNTVNSGYLYYYVQGQSVGTSTLTISAPGYTSLTANVTVDPSGFVFGTSSFSTTTFSPVSSIQVVPVVLNPTTLVSLGGSLSLNPGLGTVAVAIASSAPQVGTIATPLTFAGNSNSQVTNFTPVAAGTTNLTITQPAGFTTPAPASTQQIVATVTAPPVGVGSTTLTTGLNLETLTVAYLSQTPPSAVNVTITSASPSIATVSSSATVAGTGALVFNSVSNTNYLYYYIQGRAVGTTTLTVSAPGFSSATVNVTVDPSGFVVSTSAFSTTTFSASTNVYVQPVILTPGTLNNNGGAVLAPGIGSVSVPIVSSSPSVGTITSSITVNPGDSSDFAVFQPVSAGSTTLTISTPAAFTTPSQASLLQTTATVTAPPIGVGSTSIATGLGLQVQTVAYLSVNPPAGVTVSLTSSNPAAVVLSKSLTVAGTANLSFPSVTNGGYLYYYIQGVGLGSSTITVSAPGYTSATVTVAGDPSGFQVSTSSFGTNTFAATTAVYAQPVILSPGVLTSLGVAYLGPGSAVSVPIASSVPGVGTITTPIVFNPGDTQDFAAFQPVSAGSTTLTISTPAGFTTPSQASTQQLTATVTAPPINVGTTNLVTGANLEVQTVAYLGTNPPAPVNVTITSSNPAIATVSQSATTVGTTSIVFSGVSNTGYLSYDVQGQAIGTTTLTLSAPGFATSTVNVTVDAAGFVFTSGGSFSTTVATGTTNVTIQPAVLDPNLLTVLGTAAVNPGIGTVSVPIGSTSPQIGTISPASLSFVGGDTTHTAVFTPLQSGSTDIVIVNQPTGFSTPSQPATQQVVVTIN